MLEENLSLDYHKARFNMPYDGYMATIVLEIFSPHYKFALEIFNVEGNNTFNALIIYLKSLISKN